MIKEKNLVKNLQSLVKIPSFRDSIEVSKWIKNELEDFGYDVWSDEDGNLITEIGEGPGFILNAHMDTVEAGDGWKHGPFRGKVADGKIYGRGSSDCKAGIASMIEIARVLRKNPPDRRIVFTFTAYEEGHPPEKNGLKRVLPRLKNIEKGLILEPTISGKKIGIGVGCRGGMGYVIDIIGEMGHSAYYQNDKNPIYRFPHLLRKIEKLPQRKMNIEIIGEEITDKNSVTEIMAKEGPNVIPSRCTISLDRRALPDEKPGDFRPEIEKVCKNVLGKDYSIHEVRGLQGYLFDDEKFLSECERSVEKAGMKPDARFEKARIDGCILYNFAGIGTFMMGPGSIEQAHQLDEYCEIEGLVKATEAVLNVILFNHK
ncbi:MAG: M20/M25/M40 family metallo-hydrolase [Candidatus Aenigmarchaeota archaeon]|nr:M20/M25/M40 family metallo-hydrolase [Candidatus Aenigmarchaeota archaeon]